MTFIAQSDGGPVAPEEVDDTVQLWCVECSESLSIVRSHTRENGAFVSRYFRHPPAGSCGGGESDTHKAMKSIALSKLKETYPEHAKAALEQTIGERQADAYLRFEEPHDTLGYGVVAEAQYRNKDKDEVAVTREYHEHGYSVYWLYEDDYDDLDVELNGLERIWPNEKREYRHYEHEQIGRGAGQNLLDRLRFGCDDRPPLRVKLPQEWHEECAAKWFRETDWEDLFSEYEWDARTTLPGPDNDTKRNHHVDAVYQHGWDIDEVAVFRGVSWGSLFSDSELPEELIRAGTDFSPPSVERKVSLPGEFYDDHEDEYRRAHLIGSGEFELNYRLKPNNAGRRCSDCGEDAVAYLFTDGYVSKFVCDDCHPDRESASSERGDADKEVTA